MRYDLKIEFGYKIKKQYQNIDSSSLRKIRIITKNEYSSPYYRITICENDNVYVVFASQEIFFDANDKAIEYGYVSKLLFLQYV